MYHLVQSDLSPRWLESAMPPVGEVFHTRRHVVGLRRTHGKKQGHEGVALEAVCCVVAIDTRQRMEAQRHAGNTNHASGVLSNQ